MILSDCQAGNMSDSCLVHTLADPRANWNNCLLPFWSNEEPKTQDSKGRTVEEKSNQCSFPPLASHAIKAKCSWPKGELKNNISCCFPAPDKGPKKRDSRCKLIHLLALSALLSTFHCELINSCQQSGWTWGKLNKRWLIFSSSKFTWCHMPDVRDCFGPNICNLEVLRQIETKFSCPCLLRIDVVLGWLGPPLFLPRRVWGVLLCLSWGNLKQLFSSSFSHLTSQQNNKTIVFLLLPHNLSLPHFSDAFSLFSATVCVNNGIGLSAKLL